MKNRSIVSVLAAVLALCICIIPAYAASFGLPGGAGGSVDVSGAGASTARLQELVDEIEGLSKGSYTNWDAVMAEPLKTANDLLKRGDLTYEDQKSVDAAVAALELALSELECRDRFIIDEDGNLIFHSETLADQTVYGLQTRIYVTPAVSNGVTIGFEKGELNGEPRFNADWIELGGYIDVNILATKDSIFEGEDEIALGRIAVTDEAGYPVKASIEMKSEDFQYTDGSHIERRLEMLDYEAELDGTECEHSWQEGVVKTPATCTQNGVMEYACRWCDEVLTEEIPATGHTVVDVPEKPATCLTDGVKAHHKCSVCGLLWTDDQPDGVSEADVIVKAAGHIPSQSREGAKEATCVSEGSTGTLRCQVCGEIMEPAQVIPAKDHTPEKEREGAKEPTCEKDGYTGDLRCSVCGKVIERGEKIPAKGHIRSDSRSGARNATCAQEGYTGDVKCTVCGEVVEKGQSIAKLAHTPSSARVGARAATCTEAGTNGDIVCTVCNAVLEKGQSIPALGHQYGQEWKHDATSHWHECARCGGKGDIKPHTADKTLKNAKEATCEKDGYSGDKVCSVCGEVISKGKLLKATGHKVGEDWEFDEDGHFKTCTVCKQKVSAGKHIADKTLMGVKEATCTEDGYTGDTVCSVCAKVMVKGEIVPHLEHEFKDGKCVYCGADKRDVEGGMSGWQIALIVLGVVCAAAGGGYAYWRFRRNNADGEDELGDLEEDDVGEDDDDV